MAIRIPWTKYEVALLIDACVRFENTLCTRTEIIKDLSRRLRKLALKNNIQIDDIYRNENGISIQFQLMQGLLHNEVSGLRNSSKLFVEMKDLYYQNKSQYDKILKEAQTMLESNKKNQDNFVEWLSAQVSPAQLSELYMVYDKIDKFCIQRGMLKKPLIETMDIKIVNKVLKTVEQNKVFRFTHKREINKIISAVRYYYKYIKNQEDVKKDALDVHQNNISLQDEKTETITEVITGNEQFNAHNEAITAITEGKENSSLTRTNQDEYLLEKYPIAYKKVMASLRHSLDVVGEKGVTPNAIYENIKHIARLEAIEYILENASWSMNNGARYVFSHEIIIKDNILKNNKCTDGITSEVTPDEYEAAKIVLEADEFESEDDFEEAYYRYKKAAELGNRDGMYNLGLYYLNGLFVEQDDEVALQWLEKAANNGHSDAANDIGVYYHNSKNLRGKHFKAIKWYKLGAELGNKYSQCNLGWHYEYGMGCEVDLSLAKKYYELSAEQGFEDAIKYLKRLNGKLNISDASDSLSQFSKWLEDTLKMSPSTIRGYVSSVKVISEKAVEWNLIPYSFYKMDDSEEVKTYIEILFDNETFRKFNEEQHNRFTASLNRYSEFRTGAASSYSRRGVRSNKENDFYEWLLNEKNLAPSTCRTHLSGISEVSKFVSNNNLLDVSIFDADDETINVLFNKLLENDEFIKLNETIYNRGRTAIYKYLEFLGLNVPENSTTFRDYSEKEDAFFEWLVNEKKLATSTCRSHKIGINDVNKYVVEKGLLGTSIFDANNDTVNTLFVKLLTDGEFLKFNEGIYNRGRTSMYKYMEFLGLEIPEISVYFKSYSDKEEDFYNWLLNEKKLSPSTSRHHKAGINDANKFITENHLVDSSMFDCDAEELTSLMKRLSKNEEFIALNNSCYNRLTAAMYKYLEFISGSEVELDVDEDLDLTPYEIILQEAFPRGFRLDSAIEIKKFKRHWASLNDEDIELEDKKIEQYIKYCGVVYDGRVYSPSSMLSEELEMKLFSYINNSFSQGVSALYFEALFNEFSDDFLEYCMYNAEMLKEYLAFVNKGQYHINDNFISKDANVVVDPIDEVKRCLINASVPMSYDELYEKLSHIAPHKIKQILNFNSDFISNGRSEYFHIDITVLTEDYLADISAIITDAISDKKFMGGNELIEAISSKYPYIIENNSTISELGLRNAIGYKLKTRFAFEGNVISSKNEHLSMMDVFAEFCKKRSAFTLDELKMLKQELNTTIYFEAVYENSLRVSQTNFVSKEQAHFDTVSTDLAIDRFCTGDYISLYKIDQFGSFPDAGFQWNSYLLEHYVAMYSANYKLIHCTFNETACVGGIVKKSSHIETFDDLITDALSNSYIELEKEAALQFLCDEGYLARRHYSGIGEVLIKANELRNQKGN